MVGGPWFGVGRAPGTVGRAFVGAVDIVISVTVDSLAGLTMTVVAGAVAGLICTVTAAATVATAGVTAPSRLAVC